MNATGPNSEKGQAIIYLVLGLVVFLGFVALAIDGGMVLSDRRHAQNLADASSLAGGAAAGFYLEDHRTSMCGWTWGCSNSDVNAARNDAVTAAIRRARDNGWTIDDNVSDHNGVNTSCGAGATEFIDVTVQISTTTPSNFMQLFSTDVLQNEVEAVTRVIPGGPIAFGKAIVALNPDTSNCPSEAGMVVGGSGTITVKGGDVFSNGCISNTGEAATIKITDGKALGHRIDSATNSVWDPDPELTSETIDPKDFEVMPPDCTAPGAHNNIPGPELGKRIQTLEPGLNCIVGDVTIEGPRTETPLLKGENVTIYMVDGDFLVKGAVNMYLTAPPDSPTTYPAIPGILIYVPKSNPDGVISLNGNTLARITGFIYAPQNDVSLAGDGENIYEYTQVLAWNVKFTGNTILNLIYEGCKGYIRPPKIQLYK